MKSVHEIALELMSEGVPFACAEVVSREGSVPGASGARMLVSANESYGTIGGGSLEWTVTLLAKEQVLTTKTSAVKDFDLEDTAACGGKCQVSVSYIDPSDEKAAEFFRKSLEQEIKGRDVLYIFGGGHVAHEVAPLALRCGFDVTVIDDRAEFVYPERFPGCLTIVAPYFDAIPDIIQGESTYIVIMTRGHSYDEKVLAWAVKKQCRYLGMMGSKSKRGTLYQNMVNRGDALQSQLDTVHCPIGLAIGAQTPAEIAVSVLGELIATKYDK